MLPGISLGFLDGLELSYKDFQITPKGGLVAEENPGAVVWREEEDF
jgi:hypothetical protein